MQLAEFADATEFSSNAIFGGNPSMKCKIHKPGFRLTVVKWRVALTFTAAPTLISGRYFDVRRIYRWTRALGELKDISFRVNRRSQSDPSVLSLFLPMRRSVA